MWLLALVACHGPWPGSDDRFCSSWAKPLLADISCLDGDADGVNFDEDCDDKNWEVYPGAPEICDGLDNDCDQLIDTEDEGVQGLVTCYCDDDGDGAGMAARSTSECDTCAAREGNEDCAAWSEIPTDCNDDDAAVQQITWYEDVDGDGYGRDDSSVEACIAPAGFSGDGGDCNDDPDDRGASIGPHAPEVCYDDVDNNCSADEADTWCGMELGPVGTLPAGGTHLIGEAESNQFGYSVAVVGWPTHPHRWESGGTAPEHVVAVGIRLLDTTADDGSALNNVGGVALFTQDQGETPARVLYGEDGSETAGTSMASAGLFDGDDQPDLVVGALDGQNDGATTGRAYVVLSVADGADGTLASASVTLLGPSTASRFGGAVDGGSDVNNDGYSDVIIGAPLGDHAEACTSNQGSAYVLLGDPSATAGTEWDTRPLCSYESVPVVDDSGREVLDEDGEPLEDCVLVDPSCVPGVDPREGNAGDLIVFHGADTNEHAGQDVAFIGDVNGDGLPDMAIGANLFGDEQYGAVHLVWGWDSAGATPGAATEPEDWLLDEPSQTLYGTGLKAGAGAVVSGIGDMDGDGTTDFAVAAPSGANGQGLFQAGVVYLVMGDQLQPLLELSATGEGWPLDAFPRVEGSEAEERLGESLAALGTGVDGYADLLIGTGSANAGLDEPKGNNGLLHLVRGHPGIGDLVRVDPDDSESAWVGVSPHATVYGANDTSGFGAAAAGMVLWDDEPLIVAGAALETNHATSDGSAYLLPFAWLIACNGPGETCSLP